MSLSNPQEELKRLEEERKILSYSESLNIYDSAYGDDYRLIALELSKKLDLSLQNSKIAK